MPNNKGHIAQTNRQSAAHVVSMQKEERVIIQQSNMPDVATLEGYARVIPGGAERLIALIEKQVEHRIQLENVVVPEQVRQSRRGQWFGFIVACVAFVVSIVFLFMGQANWAGWIATSTALGMAAIFVTGKVLSTSSLQKKAPQEMQTKKHP